MNKLLIFTVAFVVIRSTFVAMVTDFSRTHDEGSVRVIITLISYVPHIRGHFFFSAYDFPSQLKRPFCLVLINFKYLRSSFPHSAS